MGGWPFVARAGELARVRRALERGRGVVIGGPAGVGKSRLAAEAVAAAPAGTVTVRAQGSEAAASIPFGAVAHLLPGTAEAGDDRLTLLRAAARELAAADVLWVDDAHLLDAGSAALLLHVASTRAAVVLATVRTDEPTPDAVTALWKDDFADRLDLAPLDHRETAELVRSVLDGDVDPRACRWLWEVSGGNPLYLRELLHLAELDSSFRRRHGLWYLDHPPAPDGRLVELLGARLRLASAALPALEALAEAGEIGVDLLASVAGASAVSAAERARLLVVERDGNRRVARLAHPLYGELVRADTPATAAAELDRKLAAALAGTGARRRGDRLQGAVWAVEGGVPGPAAELRAAAVDAFARADHDLAHRLSRLALATGAGIDAALVHAAACFELGRFEEAEDELAAWEPDAFDADADARTASQYLARRLRNLTYGLARDADAHALLDRAAARRDTRAWRDLVTALRGHVLAEHGDLAAVVETAVRVLEDPTADERARLWAVTPAGYALYARGEPNRLLRALDDVRDVARRWRPELPRAAAWVASQLFFARMVDGRIDELRDGAMRAYERALAQHDANAVGQAAARLGHVALEGGRVADAVRHYREALPPLETNDSEGYLASVLANLALALALRGDPDGARAANASARAATRPSPARIAPWASRADVWIAAADGRLSDARAAALAGADRFVARPWHVATHLHDALVLGAPPAAVAPRLRSVADAGDSDYVDALAGHAEAAAAGDVAAAEAVANRFEARGGHLRAAEAVATAASIARRTGDRRARRLESWSAALARRCEGVRSPALRAPAAVALTRREQEIAMLAARGLANAAIAGQLYVSVRTVEWHLRQAYAKLGVSRRDELADVLGERRER